VGLISFRFKTLNPAVRVETDWKIIASARSCHESAVMIAIA